MSAFYNEHDPAAAAWLRELISAGHIAPGMVDERSIEDLTPDDLAGFDQCHFFAGIGVWSRALRLAGWPDDRPVWTGSCPCQPFSAAGKGAGFADERHLWPAWHHLIAECRPAIVLGEQVASKDGLLWLDLVSADMEAAGYAFGAADLCAAGAGLAAWQESAAGEWLAGALHDCPDTLATRTLRDFADWAGANLAGDGGAHIRQRLYFVGLANADRWQRDRIANGEGGQPDRIAPGWKQGDREPQPGGFGDRLADADSQDCGGRGIQRPGQGDEAGNGAACKRPAGFRTTDRLAYADGGNACPERQQSGRQHGQQPQDGGAGRAGARDGGRSDADWLFCRDGKWRPAQPGAFPLADAAAGRVGRLRGYGNGLDAATARLFIESVMALRQAGGEDGA